MSPNMRRRQRCQADQGLNLALRLGAVVALTLVGCARPSAMQQIHARGELRMVTLNSPTCYYLGAHGPEGLEYRLATAFAQTLGVRLVVQTMPDSQAMRAALARGSVDLAAAQISPNDDWNAVGVTTTSYEQIAQLVVQSRGKSAPGNVGGLRNARVVVRADSPQEALLQMIRSNGVPDLSWTTVPLGQADPLDLVSSGNADYAIMDASEFAFDQHLYPESTVAFTLPDPRSVQWVVRSGAADLVQAANRFFAGATTSGELARIEGTANTESGDFDYESAHQFQSDIASRLPELQSMFEDAAQSTGLDWRLLAAIGYQESKWQGAAASADGAQGIMMLTSDTAATVGVNNRADLQQNILGGAKYLAQVIDTIPKRIAEPDRTWLAVAAYNVGYGHLEDARVMAQMHGKNPDAWADVREQLPLLAQERWYMRAKRGYARGWEPVKFVEQVRQYLAVLEWIGADKSAHNLSTPSRSASVAAAPIGIRQLH